MVCVPYHQKNPTHFISDSDSGRGGLESEGEIKNEDEYLADDDETVDEKEDEMIDVEGVSDHLLVPSLIRTLQMEDEIPINTVEMIENEEMIGEEGVGEIEEPPKKKVREREIIVNDEMVFREREVVLKRNQ